MFTRFVIISFALHAGAVAHFATSPNLQSQGTQSVEVEVLSQEAKVARPVVAKKRQLTHIKPTQDQQATHVQAEAGDVAEEAVPQKVISLNSGNYHPYLNMLWKTLLHKKKQAMLEGGDKRTYLVRLKITKAGLIELVDVKGPLFQVSEALQKSLAKSPRVPPVPDEISLRDFFVQYAVYF